MTVTRLFVTLTCLLRIGVCDLDLMFVCRVVYAQRLSASVSSVTSSIAVLTSVRRVKAASVDVTMDSSHVMTSVC